MSRRARPDPIDSMRGQGRLPFEIDPAYHEWEREQEWIRETRERLVCRDCGCSVHGEYYMVHDRLWPIGVDDGFLCIVCLECRIGRRLTAADFTEAPCNGPDWTQSARLRDRLEPQHEEES